MKVTKENFKEFIEAFKSYTDSDQIYYDIPPCDGYYEQYIAYFPQTDVWEQYTEMWSSGYISEDEMIERINSGIKYGEYDASSVQLSIF